METGVKVNIRSMVTRQSRVLMLDLLPSVPYYTANLCQALHNRAGLQVSLMAATYRHDRDCFRRMKLQRSHALMDVAVKLPDSASRCRRVFKAIEYLLNLVILSISLPFSRPDIVHVQFTPLVNYRVPLEVWLLKWARFLGSKIVYTVHNLLPHEHSERCRPSYAELYRIADHLICHDVNTHATLIGQFHLASEKITVIPHGPLLSPSRDIPQQDARKKIGLPSQTCLVLCQGIIRSYKGVPFLLEAWAKACKARPNTTLLIVGTGDRKILDDLAAQVHRLGIASSVRLDFRFVSVETLEAYYSAANILVYPYESITTSGALMTGMSYGKAIIASALPGFKGVLQHETNAVLVPYGDLEGWARALDRLCADANLRTQLCDMLKARSAAGLSWTDIGSATVGVYERVLMPVSSARPKREIPAAARAYNYHGYSATPRN